MMKRIAALVLVAGALFCATTAAQAANLIADGGFETPVVPVGGYTNFSNGQSIGKWSVVGAAGNVSIVSGSFVQAGYSFPAHAGHQWLDLTGDGSNSATGVQQVVRTSPGASYALTFYVGNADDPGGSFGTSSTVNVYMDGTLLMTATNTLGKGKTRLVWQEFSTTIVAAGTRTTLAFINGDPSSDNSNGLDAVSLTLLPPGTADPDAE